ncbi:MAG: hypothetical protein PUJ95_05395 [Bacteroidales bacterium]|nr:hypothetical protein [Bacteroidales bacterium]
MRIKVTEIETTVDDVALILAGGISFVRSLRERGRAMQEGEAGGGAEGGAEGGAGGGADGEAEGGAEGEAGGGAEAVLEAYDAGRKKGYNEGFNEDYDKGYDAGYDKGYDKAYADGCLASIDRKESLTDAYAEGYGDGVDAYMEKLEGVVKRDVLESVRDELYSIVRTKGTKPEKTGEEEEL